MYPFNLPGPEFLLFYIVLVIGVLMLVWNANRLLESGARPRLPLDDPFLIAYLRGGAAEALRVAVVSLVDRGLLKRHGATELVSVSRGDGGFGRRRIEQLVIERFTRRQAADAIFDADLMAAVDAEYLPSARRARLMPDESQLARRRTLSLAAGVVLAGVAGYKIYVALAAGRTNVLFLCLLVVVALFLLRAPVRKRLTPVGQRALEELRMLFAGLTRRVSRIEPGGTTTEAVMLAAVFGIGMLPETAFPYVKELYGKAYTSGSTGSCGSACGAGSSSCGGGGSGCGGCGGGGGD